MNSSMLARVDVCLLDFFFFFLEESASCARGLYLPGTHTTLERKLPVLRRFLMLNGLAQEEEAQEWRTSFCGQPGRLRLDRK